MSISVEPMPIEKWDRFTEEIDAIADSVQSLPVPSFPSRRATYGWARAVLWAASLRPARSVNLS